jgi:hypothetical protein
MALTLDGTATAAAAAGARGVAWLVDLEFVSGTLTYTTAPLSITVGGVVYQGYGDLVSVSTVGESEDSNADKLTLGVALVNTAMLAATLGDVDGYRGRRARLWLQLYDETFTPAGAPVQRWAGFMDRVTVDRSPAPATGGPSGGRINIECSRAGMARARNASGLRLTHAQQQARFAGDLGLEYLQTLIEQPSLWLSKRFQQQ